MGFSIRQHRTIIVAGDREVVWVQVPSPAPAAYRRGFFERGLFKASFLFVNEKIFFGVVSLPNTAKNILCPQMALPFAGIKIRVCSHKPKCSDCEADFSHSKAIFRSVLPQA